MFTVSFRPTDLRVGGSQDIADSTTSAAASVEASAKRKTFFVFANAASSAKTIAAIGPVPSTAPGLRNHYSTRLDADEQTSITDSQAAIVMAVPGYTTSNRHVVLYARETTLVNSRQSRCQKKKKKPSPTAAANGSDFALSTADNSDRPLPPEPLHHANRQPQSRLRLPDYSTFDHKRPATLLRSRHGVPAHLHRSSAFF
jgi:hypothetical protein